jgi:hypothetical protein
MAYYLALAAQQPAIRWNDFSRSLDQPSPWTLAWSTSTVRPGGAAAVFGDRVREVKLDGRHGGSEDSFPRTGATDWKWFLRARFSHDRKWPRDGGHIAGRSPPGMCATARLLFTYHQYNPQPRIAPASARWPAHGCEAPTGDWWWGQRGQAKRRFTLGGISIPARRSDMLPGAR